jgi:hypothetical protein
MTTFYSLTTLRVVATTPDSLQNQTVSDEEVNRPQTLKVMILWDIWLEVIGKLFLDVF